MTTQQINTETVDEQQKERNRRAFRLLLTLGIIIFTASIAVFLRIWVGSEFTYQPDLAEPGAGIVGGLLIIGSAFIARRGHITLAVALVSVVFFAVDFFLMSRLNNIALPLTITVTVGLILIASQTLQQKYVVSGIILIFFTGVIFILLDLFWPTPRGFANVKDLQIVYVASLVVLGVALVVAVRQFPNFSLRSKLVSGAITLIVLTVFLTTILVNNFTRSALTQELDEKFQLVGGLQALTVSELLGRQIEILEGLSLDKGLRTALVIHNTGFRYIGTEEENLQRILRLDEQWPTNIDLQRDITLNSAALTLRGMQENYTNHTQLKVIDRRGALVGATHASSQYYYGNEDWWQFVNSDDQGHIYFGEPEVDTFTGQITTEIIAPVYDTLDSSVINGFVISNYSLIEVAVLLQRSGDIGKTGHWDLIFDDASLHLAGQSLGLELIETDEGLLNMLQESSGNIVAEAEGQRSLLGLVPVDTDGEIPVIDDLGWSLIVSQAEEEAFATIKVQQRVAIIMALVAIIVGAVIAMYAAGYIANPINRLTETAVIISEGNLNRRASIETQDEIGTLALAFNRMTDQLRNFIGSLETQVLERTKALATSTEVSRQLSTILNMDDLVSEVVNQIRNSFGYYHAQIYLYDEAKEYLVMAGGTGSAGQKMLAAGHKLAHGRGLVGRAAELNQIVLISDVSRNENWLANELLPHTQSEAAVPIALGNEVFGVLDVQHNVAGGLDEEGVDLLQSIANQIAIAIQNARQYEQTQAALAESERLYNVTEEQAQRLAVLNEMSAEFNTAVNEQAIYNIIGEKLLGIIVGEIVSLALFNAESETVEINWLNGEIKTLPDKQTMPLTGTVNGRALQENRILQLPADGGMSDFADSRYFVEAGYLSLLILPLTAGGQVIGTLMIGRHDEPLQQVRNMDLLQQVASTIATNLESMRISERANLLASIVENHPDFIGIGTLSGEALYINPSGLKLLSLSPDTDLADVNVSKIYSPEDGAVLLSEGVPIAMETGSWTDEVNINKFDGTTLPVEETIGINYDANHQPISFSMTMRDITERKEAENAVQQSRDIAEEFQEKLKTLYQITVALSKENDLDMVFKKAVEDARVKLDIDRLGFWLFDETVTEMRGTFGTNAQGELEDARDRRRTIAENVDGSWILPFINDNQRFLVNEDADLYDDNTNIVGHGWQVIVILWNEEQPLGFLSVDNLIFQQPMKPYEPDLVILFANALSNIIVNKRTEAARVKQARELQTVAEVSRTATTILDVNELLQKAVDLTKEQFNLYHAHVYLMNHNQEFLVLTAGAGEIGRIMVAERREIPVRAAQSVVAQAARTKKGIVVNNVFLEPGFLPNPLLPETRAELATPIMVGDEVLGVLDIQSNEINHFAQSDLDVQTTLASQIAVAMQNAKQYQQTQEALENVTRMQKLLVEDGWKTFVENQAEAVQGYWFDQQSLQPFKREDVAANDRTVFEPLTVRGATIGKLGVRDRTGRPVSKEKQELLQSMTTQVAEALERARLFQQTEVARVQTEAALKETRRRTEELSSINQIVTDLGASLDVSQSMNIVVNGITQSLDVEQCRIALLDDDGQSLTIVAEQFNTEKSVSALGISIPIEGNALTQHVMETRRPMIVEDVANDPRVDVVRELLQAQGIRSLAVLPMIVGTTVLGTVGIDLLNEGQRFTEDQIELAQTIIFQAATAVQNARLYTETQRRAEKERLVNTINQKIQGTTTVESALQTAIEELGRALHAQKTRVALHLEKSYAQEENGRNGTN